MSTPISSSDVGSIQCRSSTTSRKGPDGGERFQRLHQHLEQPPLLPLRRHVDRRVLAFDAHRQQVREQRHDAGCVHRELRNQGFELAQAGGVVVVFREARRDRELADDRRQRRALQVRRAVVPDAQAVAGRRSARPAPRSGATCPRRVRTRSAPPGPGRSSWLPRAARSSSSSATRFTSGVRVDARNAWKRLPTLRSPITRQAGTGASNPLSSWWPRSR